MELNTKLKVYLASAVLAVSCASVIYAILKHKRRYKDAFEALYYMNVRIVTNENVCDEVVNEIRRRSKVQHAVGFDCEWVTANDKRQAVALLQLSTFDGYCGLFRLNQMKTIPNSLKALDIFDGYTSLTLTSAYSRCGPALVSCVRILFSLHCGEAIAVHLQRSYLQALLEDETIFKVGVAPTDDAKYLFQDYSATLKSTLDVRHLARICGHSASGLAALSKTLLHIVLDKNWKLRCSNWEAEQLTSKQVVYAAADAHVAIKIFQTLICEYGNRGTFGWFLNNKKDVKGLCTKYLDVAFKVNRNKQQGYDTLKKEKYTKNESLPLSKRYTHGTRSKPLYHNCFLQAPDGELLCTCDNKKARWYAEKGLARVVAEEPLTVRLRFEPAGRSVGVVGRYYQLAKENKCVVCGNTDSYIRKNVVPREYRKYFPEVMKEHSSHDVVLLCVRCHQRANALDQRVREALAALCAAPLATRAPHRASGLADAQPKRVRSAARALLFGAQKHALPAARHAELEATVRRHYGGASLSPALLHEAAALPYESIPMEEESHGMKVVEYYLKHDGLLRLEEYWREHFLHSMEPKYMPQLWSTKHNEERLRVKFDEGRLSEEDLQSIGLSKWL